MKHATHIGLALLAAVVLSAPTSRGATVSDGRESILVIPFNTIHVAESQQWIAKGIQESLIANFGKSDRAIAFQGQLVVEDDATAARLARQASANLAVRGAVQIVGATARLTAQLVDAQSGQTVRTASATGAVSDLLTLEDDLAAQLRGLPSNPNTPTISPVTTVAGGVYSAGAPGVYTTYGEYADYPQAYAYSIYYPYYPYSYSYVGWPFFFSSTVVIHRENHDHDHGHAGGGRGEDGHPRGNAHSIINAGLSPTLMTNPGAAPMINPGNAPIINPGNAPIINPGAGPIINPGAGPWLSQRAASQQYAAGSSNIRLISAPSSVGKRGR